jgi:AcrR family transcriptional regulator
MPKRTRAQTRQELFDAALELFAARGFQDTSHADIAAFADIGRTTFYEYFASTEDLLVELVEDRLPTITDEMVGSVPADLSPALRLGTLVNQFVHFVGTDHLGLILHTEAPRLSDEAQQRIAAAHLGLSHAFGAVYRDGVVAGEFRDLPGRLAGRFIHEVIMTAGREVMDSDEPKADVHAVADEAVRFLLAGLAA